MMRSPARPVDVQPAVVEPAADVAGRQPAVAIERVGAVAVGPQQHRTAQADLRRRRRCATSTPSSGRPSYTTPLPVSVMPYVVTAFAGRSAGGAAPPSTIVRNDRRVDAAQRGGDERDVGGADAGDEHRLEARQHRERRRQDHRPRDDRQAADVGQRQARQPVVVLRRAEAGAGRLRRRGDGVVGEHDALRHAGRAARGDDEGVAGLDGPAVVEATSRQLRR